MKTLIIGGGLSGLALAERLEATGQDYLLLEARDRFGGRIMTEHVDRGVFDMGPAWFWPGQPRIEALTKCLGLSKFAQYAAGELTYEDASGRVQRGVGFASMEGSWRLQGGLTALTDALQQRVPDARKRLNAQVTRVQRTDATCQVTLTSGEAIDADRVVLALPPRIAADMVFHPPLPVDAVQAMANIPTWMAGQAKAIAVYDRPFWRDAGLSGDAMSRRGPMVEIHDASPAEGGPYALFGFIGVPPQARGDRALLERAILDQFTRLFGDEAASPRALFVKDWAFDPLTATPADAAPPRSHPIYGKPSALRGLWDGHLILSGSELGRSFGGYLEGALEAAEAVLDEIEAAETTAAQAT